MRLSASWRRRGLKSCHTTKSCELRGLHLPPNSPFSCVMAPQFSHAPFLNHTHLPPNNPFSCVMAPQFSHAPFLNHTHLTTPTYLQSFFLCHGPTILTRPFSKPHPPDHTHLPPNNPFSCASWPHNSHTHPFLNHTHLPPNSPFSCVMAPQFSHAPFLNHAHLTTPTYLQASLFLVCHGPTMCVMMGTSLNCAWAGQLMLPTLTPGYPQV